MTQLYTDDVIDAHIDNTFGGPQAALEGLGTFEAAEEMGEQETWIRAFSRLLQSELQLPDHVWN